jgi:hypothetical protein
MIHTNSNDYEAAEQLGARIKAAVNRWGTGNLAHRIISAPHPNIFRGVPAPSLHVAFFSSTRNSSLCRFVKIQNLYCRIVCCREAGWNSLLLVYSSHVAGACRMTCAPHVSRLQRAALRCFVCCSALCCCRRYRLLEIELDAVYRSMLLLKKKKYAAIKVSHMRQ